MHLAFVDPAYGYTADRPDAPAPLGGTTSAVCFLARALSAAGHTATLFNKVQQEAAAHGVRSLPLEQLTAERASSAYDAFIFCGRWTEWLVQHVAEGARVPLITWMHESRFAPPLVPVLPQFSGVVFVSDWQHRGNQFALLPRQRATVIRNAVNPLAVTLFAPHETITTPKLPVAVYVGSTPRGVLHLPAIWPPLHAAFPDLRLRIFCNPAIGQDAAQNAALAAQLRAMPGVEHLGMVGQPELLKNLRAASFFLAPNPYPETSCIALMEALAAGLNCIVTARGALPETAQGYATLVPIAAADDLELFTQPLDHAAFVSAAHGVIADRLAAPASWETQLQAQRRQFLQHYVWSERVQDWIDWVASLQQETSA